MGRLAIHTVADGDCGIETMLFFEGVVRNVASTKGFRVQQAEYLMSIAGDPNWQSSWDLCGECVDVPEAPPPKDTLGAKVDALAVASPALAHQHSTALAGVVAPALAVVAAKPSEPSDCARACGDDALVLAAVVHHVGLKHFEAVQARHLLDGIDKAALHVIVQQYQAVEPHAKKEIAAKQIHKWRDDVQMQQKRSDSRFVAEYCSKNGLEPSASTLPHNFWTQFLIATYGKAGLDAGEHGSRKRLQMYWSRRLRDYTSGKTKQPAPKGARRSRGKQGRPLKGDCLEGELCKWFAQIRRRGVRVTPAAFLRQAKLFRLQLMRRFNDDDDADDF